MNMLDWVLLYLLAAFFLHFWCAHAFGLARYKNGIAWEFVSVLLWPLVFLFVFFTPRRKS